MVPLVRSFRTVVLSSVLLSFSLLAWARAEDWPQWGRDASRNMVADAEGLPASFVLPEIRGDKSIDLSPAKNIKWVGRLGSESYGNVTVAGGKVFIGTNGPSSYDSKYTASGGGVLLCFDEKSGSFLWQLVVPKLTPANSKFTSDQWSAGICSSPTVVGNRVYLTSNRGEILCLDADGLTNGNDGPFVDEARYVAGPEAAPVTLGPTDADIIWRYDMIGELGIWPHDATNCSVLVEGDFVYAGTSNGTDSSHRNIPFPNAPSFIALRKDTGILAAVDNAEIGLRVFNGQWSSPSSAVIKDKGLLFYGGGDGLLYAFNALSTHQREGIARLEKVWWCNCNPPEYKIQDQQRNSLGSRRRAQCEIIGTPVFYKGYVYVAIGQDPNHGRGKGCLVCIDASLSGDITGSGKLWSYDQIDRSVSTAAIADDLLYIGDTSGRFHCLDAQTGECYWTHEMPGSIWGSALAADGKVYFGDTAGNFVILKTGKEKRVMSEAKFGAPICSTPIAANGGLYVADHTHLFAIQER